MLRTLSILLLSMSGLLAEIDFSHDIRPILNVNCTGCHGGVKKQGGVSFLYREQVLAKGDSGKPTVVPGNPDASEMMYRITTDNPDHLMPQPEHGPRLKEDEIALIRQWIQEGASWNNHWSFEKPTRHPVPETPETDWTQNDIDRFLLARMKAEGLSPNPVAKPSRLLRRLHLDLTGYPPTLDEIDHFEQSFAINPDTAVTTAIDKLLAQPAYGEKWASQWLDLARYADSEGLGLDRRWNVWPYRDWVIRALNNDLPYDEFLIKQLAGDLLQEPTMDDLIATTFHRLTQQNGEGGTDNEEFRVLAVMDRANTTWEALQGVTFACVQCHDHPYDPIRHDEYYRFLAFFNSTRDLDRNSHHPVLHLPKNPKDFPQALTLRKRIQQLQQKHFKEVSQLVHDTPWQKVTGLQATAEGIRAKTRESEGYTEFLAQGTIPTKTAFHLTFLAPSALPSLTAVRVHTLPLDVTKAKHSPELGAVISRIALQVQLPGKAKPKVVPISTFLGDDINPEFDPDGSLEGGKNPHGWGARSHQYHPRSGVAVLEQPLSLPPGATLTVSIYHRDKSPTGPMAIKRGRLELTDSPAIASWLDQHQSERKELKDLRQKAKKIGRIPLPVMEELSPHLSRATHTFLRGNWLEKGPEAHKPDTPKSLPALQSTHEIATRLDLARWIASPENPFTARVLVARVWEQIFGIGLVETLEDFGSAGLLPTHGKLLDDLAVRFQTEMNWSVKTLIREILLSAAYRQSAKMDSLKREKDPRNLFLARGPRNRLSAEHIRDHHLHVSGLLNPTLYGGPVRPPIPDGVWKPFSDGPWQAAKVGDPNRYRRALYTYRKRSIPHPSMDAFDAPTRELCSTRRLTSNTPLAALVTLNSEGFAEMAAGLAKRMKDTTGGLDAQLTAGYRLATSVRPTGPQLQLLNELFEKSSGDPYLNVASTLLNLDDALTK